MKSGRGIPPLLTTRSWILRSIWRMLSTSERTLSQSFSTWRAEKRICISSFCTFFCSSTYLGALCPSFCSTTSIRAWSFRIVANRVSAATLRRSRFSAAIAPASPSSSLASTSSSTSSSASSASLKSIRPSTRSSILNSSFSILLARSRICATVIGQAEIAMIMCFRPSSIRLAISISPSRVRSSTEPISRMYMRTGSVVRPNSESSVDTAASAASSTSSAGAVGAASDMSSVSASGASS